MQTDDLENLLRPLKSLKLSAEEKRRIRGRLLDYVALHPAPRASRFWQDRLQVFLGRLLSWPASLVVTAVAVVLIFGGVGMAFAAERALPGDALYPVKLRVIEKFRLSTALSPAAKAQVELLQISNRLSEAEVLASQGRFQEGNTSQLKRSLEALIGSFNGRVEQINAAGDFSSSISLSSGLEGQLRSHAEVLQELDDRQTLPAAGPFLSDLRQDADKVTENRQSAESRVFSDTSADLRRKAEAKRGWSAQSFIAAQAQVDKLPPSQLEGISRRVEKAKDWNSQADSELEKGNYGSAYVLYQQAQQAAEEAGILASARVRFSGREAAERTEVPVRDGGGKYEGAKSSPATEGTSGSGGSARPEVRSRSEKVDETEEPGGRDGAVPLLDKLQFGH